MITDVIREQMAKSIHYIKPISYNNATALTAELYQHMMADFMPVPPVTLHSPVPKVMAGVWSILQETLHVGNVDRGIKEAVASAVSKVNECPYCVDVHTSMLHATEDHNAALHILRGSYDRIRDPEIQAIVQWIMANRTSNAKHTRPPFSQVDAPEIIGTAVAFHYINRMVNVFLGDTFVPVPSMFKPLTGRFFGATAGKKLIQCSVQSGNTLKFLPKADLPDDLSWAASNPIVAAAFAGFAQITEEAATNVLPKSVRDVIYECIEAWGGESMGMSRGWVEHTTNGLKPEERVAARLALLTALASYQVDSSVVEEFRFYFHDDTQLVSVTAWASFMAARRASTWLAASLT